MFRPLAPAFLLAVCIPLTSHADEPLSHAGYPVSPQMALFVAHAAEAGDGPSGNALGARMEFLFGGEGRPLERVFFMRMDLEIGYGTTARSTDVTSSTWIPYEFSLGAGAAYVNEAGRWGVGAWWNPLGTKGFSTLAFSGSSIGLSAAFRGATLRLGRAGEGFLFGAFKPSAVKSGWSVEGRYDLLLKLDSEYRLAISLRHDRLSFESFVTSEDRLSVGYAF